MAGKRVFPPCPGQHGIGVTDYPPVSQGLPGVRPGIYTRNALPRVFVPAAAGTADFILVSFPHEKGRIRATAGAGSLNRATSSPSASVRTANTPGFGLRLGGWKRTAATRASGSACNPAK